MYEKIIFDILFLICWIIGIFLIYRTCEKMFGDSY